MEEESGTCDPCTPLAARAIFVATPFDSYFIFWTNIPPHSFDTISFFHPFWNRQVLRYHEGAAANCAIFGVPEQLQLENDVENIYPVSILQPSIKHSLGSIVYGICGLYTEIHVDDFPED